MSTKLIAFVLLSLFAGAHSWLFGGSGRQPAAREVSQDCINKARNGDCNFFLCFDQRHPCERHNYAMSYGWRFCQKFDEKMQDLTTEAQEWVRNARRCEMEAMLEFYQNDHINCHDVEHAMKDKFSECEFNFGVCDGSMLFDNRQTLTDIYKFNRKTLTRFMGFLRQCGTDGAERVIDWVKSQKGAVRDLLDRFRGIFS